MPLKWLEPLKVGTGSKPPWFESSTPFAMWRSNLCTKVQLGWKTTKVLLWSWWTSLYLPLQISLYPFSSHLLLVSFLITYLPLPSESDKLLPTTNSVSGPGWALGTWGESLVPVSGNSESNQESRHISPQMPTWSPRFGGVLSSVFFFIWYFPQSTPKDLFLLFLILSH